MTHKEAQETLARYPWLWVRCQNLRANIINRYNAEHVSRKAGGYGDKTGRAAVKLLELADIERRVKITGRFIEEGLPPEDRMLLINVWRGLPWRLIAEREGCSEWLTRLRWQAMVERLRAYAGHV